MVQGPTAALVGELRRRGEEAGLAAVGIAPATPMESTRRILEERKAAGLSANMQFTYRNPARSTDPSRLLPGAAALVVGAWPYGGEPYGGEPYGGAAPPAGRPPDGRPKGIVARYASRDHYADLATALRGLADVLKGAGWQARVIFDDNALVDRAAAERAGLGWFGKNSNVLLPGRGSWFLLGSVVTDAPLPVGTPVEDGCGTCQRCLGSCPTRALVAPGVLDARRCLAWLLQAPGVFPFEYRAALGGRIYGCDDCQDVCPANRLAATAVPRQTASASRAHRSEQAEVDLLEMLASSGSALLARYGRWYIPERGPSLPPAQRAHRPWQRRRRPVAGGGGDTGMLPRRPRRPPASSCGLGGNLSRPPGSGRDPAGPCRRPFAARPGRAGARTGNSVPAHPYVLAARPVDRS